MRTLEHTVDIDAPASVVWRVLTTRDLVREWAAAFLDEIDIRCGWRLGAPVEWRSPDGTVLQRGTVGAFEPGKLLRFDYPLDPDSFSSARVGGFYDAWILGDEGGGTRLTAMSGPLTAEHYADLQEQHLAALQTIRSLAEEAAEIGRRAGSTSPKP